MALEKIAFIKILQSRRKKYTIFKNIFFFLLPINGVLLLIKQSKGIELDVPTECFAMAVNYYFYWRMAKSEEIAEGWIANAMLSPKEQLTYDDVTLQRK